jgi:hypothetical protein
VADGISRWQQVVGIAGLAVVVWVGVDSPLVDAWFRDGPGDMEHGPVGDGPPAGVDQDPVGDAPAEDPDQEMDPDAGGHDPMDHG